MLYSHRKNRINKFKYDSSGTFSRTKMINNYLERQIKENFPYQPTFEQEIAVKSLSEFLLSTLADEVFILRGYAGTGKTSLVGALVKTMDQLQQRLCYWLLPVVLQKFFHPMPVTRLLQFIRKYTGSSRFLMKPVIFQ